MNSLSPLLSTCGALLVFAILVRFITFLSSGWYFRKRIRSLGRQGKPMLPHSLTFGHLLEAHNANKVLPPGAHNNYILDVMGNKLGNADAFYFDTYPISEPFLVLRDPDLANQATRHAVVGAHKPASLRPWFSPISGRGGSNLFSENGQEWKENHNLFMPFFNNSNLDAAMPIVLDEVAIFRQILSDRAKSGAVFQLKPLVLSLMNDIIGRIVFNAELGNQKGEPHPLSQTMLRQLEFKFGESTVVGRLSLLDISRRLKTWNNSRLLDFHIRAQISSRVAKRTEAEKHQGVFTSIIDQAINMYFSQRQGQAPCVLDSAFLNMLCAQLRMFFFAGYDSTAATMVACCYTIWQHPEALARLRAEHNEVFGTDTSACADVISRDPAILNSLPYTTAAIKETMRLFPPAAGIRTGSADLVLRGADGMEYPTEGVSVQINHVSIQRNPKIWVRPNEFLPERFLAEPGDELYPAKGAWRPFEYGTRLCIGQALVMKEVKVFLALLAREFDVEECYDEVFKNEVVDLTHVHGEKAYLLNAAAAHLRGDLPCRVTVSAVA